MKISESPYGMSETYTVKFWYKNDEGFTRQTEEDFYTNSKSAHEEISKFALKTLSQYYKNIEIISVTYC